MDESPEGVAWCCGSDVGLLSIDMKLFNDYVVLRTIRSSNPVSYTHLDVYKRQDLSGGPPGPGPPWQGKSDGHACH